MSGVGCDSRIDARRSNVGVSEECRDLLEWSDVVQHHRGGRMSQSVRRHCHSVHLRSATQPQAERIGIDRTTIAIADDEVLRSWNRWQTSVKLTQ